MPKKKVSKERAAGDQLFRIRHSAAHLMAAAVLKLYPDAKLGTGPATEDGFFYDIETAEPLAESDLPRIEKEMRALVAAGHPFTCVTVSVDEARSRARKAEQPYKLELIEQLAKDGSADVTYYETGDVFEDLCEGPHVDETSEVGAFKLLSVAGAYWRGDASKAQMSRIYGTAFATQAELDEYLTLRAEARKRDHKKLGIELDLFTWSDLVGSGLPLFTPRGTTMIDVLDAYVWQLRRAKGYVRVEIPHITKKALYVKSGHWDKFHEELFRIKSREGHEFALKPMNCPHHTQIFARRPHSYREMPVRYANTTACYRDEQTGELTGLIRTRSFIQDDAHVFARAAQVEAETLAIWDIVEEFYGTIGFAPRVRLSLSDPKHPEKYLGTREIWDRAEQQLRDVVRGRAHDNFTEAIGEAALYGPKIDFLAKDSLGREHQVATIQLDLNQPERFGLTCIDEAGKKEPIVMIHAAIMGSIGRYMAIAIEHFGGAFPVWMAPVQISVVPVSEEQDAAAGTLLSQLQEVGLRAELLGGGETLGKRIRRAEKLKVPYVAVLGAKEVVAGTVSVRRHGKGDLGALKLDAFVQQVRQENESRAL